MFRDLWFCVEFGGRVRRESERRGSISRVVALSSECGSYLESRTRCHF